MSKSKLWIFLNVCFLVLGIWSLAPAALAAVPTWTVGFDANTDFEKSLEGFLTRLMGQVSARQETFQQSYDLAKIMKGREDVNKLIFESFSELRNEPLLLEFQEIRRTCESSSANFEDQKGTCAFYTQVKEYLRTRGLEIVSKPFLPSANQTLCEFDAQDKRFEDGRGDPCTPNAGLLDGVKSGEVDPLCIYGVRTNDGECITIKLEGRVITNPDDFMFEEPIQKARDFLYCYFGPWRHYPWAATQDESDLMRDNMKNHFLLTVARKLKFTQTAAPPEWYTEARCQIILAGMQCPVSSQPLSVVSNVQDATAFKTINRDQACVSRELVQTPTLKAPLEFMNWTMSDLREAVVREENTVQATYNKVANVIQGIIADYRQLRNAQYIAGQGIRPEKYLVGYRSYTEDEYKKLVSAWEAGGTIEDEARQSVGAAADGVAPTGDWFYYDTENIISPAVILLDKIQAATQAEFDLARDAFQAVKVPDSPADDIAYSGPGECPGDKTPTDPTAEGLKRLGYTCYQWQANHGGPFFHYWSTSPKNLDSDNVKQDGLYALDGGRALAAPWEDTSVVLPKEYLTGQKPTSVDENPALSGNYFNRWYKDILELHKWHFSAVVQQWFKKPEKSFFSPDR